MSSPKTTSSAAVLTGSCQCGEVKLSSTALPLWITFCHCKQCRKMTGGPFMSCGQFENSSISWTGKTTESGPPFRTRPSHITKSGAPIGYRGSCNHCGSPLWMKYSCEPQHTSVAMGIVDDESVKGELPKPKGHIFLGEKASWWEMADDGLERWELYTKDFPQIMNKWEEDGCPKRKDVD